MRFAETCCSLALLCLVIAGCGEGGGANNFTPVTGVVTLDGAPLAAATVEFQPKEAGGSPSYGQTDASGSYTLRFTYDKAGAKPGEYIVRVSKLEGGSGTAGDDDDDDDDDNDDDASEGVETLPERYNVKTELTATVAPGKNTINFDLTSK